jgi:hypothetical protein
LKTSYSSSQLTKRYYIITPANLIKALKQFFRLIQYFKKQESLLHVQGFKNEYFFNLYKTFSNVSNIPLKDILFEKKLFFSSNISKIKSIYLTFSNGVSQKQYGRLLNSGAYIIVELNSVIKKEDLGCYKVFSDFNDWKKHLFVFLILKTIYKKS